MVNESKKKLEFKVIFNHINNLKNEEKGEKSLGSLELEGDSYAISISGNSKELSEIAPMLFSRIALERFHLTLLNFLKYL